MNSVLHLRCIDCGRTFSAEPDRYVCPEDGGLLDVEYDYDRAGHNLSRDGLASSPEASMWRYLPLLPVRPDTPRPPLRVGFTPLYPAPRLGRAMGIEQVYVKDDGLNPTGSLKDRPSAMAVVKAKESGASVIACASTGNAASSLAGQAASAGMPTCIFVPERAPLGKLAQMVVFGATVIKVLGSYEETYRLSAWAIERFGWYNRNAAINPYLIEGKKTVAMEIVEQLDFQPPDWVVMSVGDGCSIAGAYKGFLDMHRCGLAARIPRLLAVQAEGCAPLARAFRAGTSEFVPEPENTIADSIAVGVPRNPIKALSAVRKSEGTFVTVGDEEILSAMKMLGTTAGVFAEPAASASVAGLARAKEMGIISRGDTVVVVVTGNGLKDPGRATQAGGEIITLPPEISLLEDALKDRMAANGHPSG
ncbi:MAG: threonine synthase [Bacillota bacterium]